MTDETVIAPGHGGPRRVGKYSIEGVLGEGAMGVVYAGQDPDIDRPVAIKTIHQHLISEAGSRDWMDRFAREARAAGRVLHPNLVTVFDFLQQDGVPYMVMERVRSITLQDRRAAPEPLSLEEIHAIMAQILSGLACIHAAGIVHRDLKPANVMLTEDGTIKLTDFGIARLTAMEATGAGMVGTPSYMAPEQLTGSNVDARADIYATGVVLYELLTGQKPYKGGGVEALFEVVRNGQVPRPSSVQPGLPPALDDVVLTAMNVDPDQRYTDAVAMREALAAVLPAASRSGLIDVAPAAPARGGAAGGDTTSATLLESLDSQTLVRVEQRLTSSIGPIGRVIARRAAAGATSPQQMIETVLKEFGDADERERMRAVIKAALADTTGTSLSATLAGPATSGNFPEDSLQELSDLLMPHVGPIARVLVRKKAVRAASAEDLITQLAGTIEDTAARTRFTRHAQDILCP